MPVALITTFTAEMVAGGGGMDTHSATAGLAQIFFFGNVILFVVFTLLGSIDPQVSEYGALKTPHDE